MASEMEHYQLRVFHEGAQQFYVYVHGVESALARLIEGYHPTTNPTPQ